MSRAFWLLAMVVASEVRADPGVAAHSAVYDGRQQRMIVTGGYTREGHFTDAWALTLQGTPTWRPLVPLADWPPGRSRATAIWDEAGQRVLVFGGQAELAMTSVADGEVWELAAGASAWRKLAVKGPRPPGRSSHSAVYDPAGRRMIVHGGIDGQGQLLADTWSLSLAGTPTWGKLAGPPKPTPRALHAAAWDVAGRRMIIVGGIGHPSYLAGGWSVELAGAPRWTPLAGPAPRRAPLVVVDAAGKRLLLFGGSSPEGRPISDEVHVLGLGDGRWQPLAVAPGPRPAPREHSAGIWDPVGRRLVLFGGLRSTATHRDVWELAFQEMPPRWRDITPPGPGPAEHRATAIATPRCRPKSHFGCRPVTQGAAIAPGQPGPPTVCGCIPDDCKMNESHIVVSAAYGTWKDGSNKGTFSCASQLPP